MCPSKSYLVCAEKAMLSRERMLVLLMVSHEFKVKAGVHHGCVRSPRLFIIVLELREFRSGVLWEDLYASCRWRNMSGGSRYRKKPWS